tara:strand:+ start:273 stop:725 length:453 start_codon:yes stop_codon:yes gene_type:complete
MPNTKISIASDHGGRLLKYKLSLCLSEKAFEIIDHGVGVDDTTSVDYPDFARKVALDVSSKKAWRGLLICGTGIGMSLAANRVKGVRATLVWDEYTAAMSRAHNNSNILVMGERTLNHDRALDYLNIWLETQFDSRHQRRLDKIETLCTS